MCVGGGWSPTHTQHVRVSPTPSRPALKLLGAKDSGENPDNRLFPCKAEVSVLFLCNAANALNAKPFVLDTFGSSDAKGPLD